MAQFTKGLGKFTLHFALLVFLATLERAGERGYWRALRSLVAGICREFGCTGLLRYDVAQPGGEPRRARDPPADRLDLRAINKYGAVGTTDGEPDPTRSPATRTASDHALRPAARASRPLPAARARQSPALPLGAVLAFLLLVDVGTLSRGGILGLSPAGRPRRPLRRALLSGGCTRRGSARLLVAPFAETHRTTSGSSSARASRPSAAPPTRTRRCLRVHPDVLHLAPADRSRAEQLLALLPVRHGEEGLGPHSFYVALSSRAGLLGRCSSRSSSVRLPPAGPVRRVGLGYLAPGDPAAARVRPLGVGADSGARRDDGGERSST